jgi:hypothetical protein
MAPSCSLTKAGLEAQRGRYARLAPHVISRTRRPGAIEVHFGEGVDRGVLEEAVATERECCPFFEIAFDEGVRRLSVAVGRREHEPALAAIAEALTA